MPQPTCPGCNATSPWGQLCRRCSAEFHSDGPMVRDLTAFESRVRQRRIDAILKTCPAIARRMTPFGDGPPRRKGKRKP